MAEITLYLKLQIGFQEKMSECWKQCEESFTKQTINAAPEAACKAKAKPKPSPKPQPHKRGVDPESDGKTPKKGKSNLETLLVDSAKVKVLYSRVMSKAENLVETITTADAWAWARTSDSIGKLEKLIKEVKTQVASNENIGRMVLEDLKDLKADMGEKTLEAAATALNLLKPGRESIDQKQSSLVKAHKTMKS